MSGSSRGCAVSKPTDKKVRRLCHGNQGKVCENRCGQVRVERRFVRPPARGNDEKWKALEKSTPGKLRRSTSLLSISPQCSSASESSMTMRNELQDEERPNSWRQDLLAWKVLFFFSRNLSRKRKQHVEDMNRELEESDETVKKLNIQICVLKDIIKNDGTVMELWKKQLQDSKQLLGSSLKQYDQLKNDFEGMSESVEKMKEKINELETENNNLKNTELILKSERTLFEGELEKERASSSSLQAQLQVEVVKYKDAVQRKTEEMDALKKEREILETIAEKKSSLIAVLETKLNNNTRLFQNSVKEIRQLSRETLDLRRTNKLLKDQIASMKNSMALLENNQQQIHKYFNMNID